MNFHLKEAEEFKVLLDGQAEYFDNFIDAFSFYKSQLDTDQDECELQAIFIVDKQKPRNQMKKVQSGKTKRPRLTKPPGPQTKD